MNKVFVCRYDYWCDHLGCLCDVAVHGCSEEEADQELIDGHGWTIKDNKYFCGVHSLEENNE